MSCFVVFGWGGGEGGGRRSTKKINNMVFLWFALLPSPKRVPSKKTSGNNLWGSLGASATSRKAAFFCVFGNARGSSEKGSRAGPGRVAGMHGAVARRVPGMHGGQFRECNPLEFAGDLSQAS